MMILLPLLFEQNVKYDGWIVTKMSVFRQNIKLSRNQFFVFYINMVKTIMTRPFVFDCGIHILHKKKYIFSLLETIFKLHENFYNYFVILCFQGFFLFYTKVTTYIIYVAITLSLKERKASVLNMLEISNFNKLQIMFLLH